MRAISVKRWEPCCHGRKDSSWDEHTEKFFSKNSPLVGLYSNRTASSFVAFSILPFPKNVVEVNGGKNWVSISDPENFKNNVSAAPDPAGKLTWSK